LDLLGDADEDTRATRGSVLHNSANILIDRGEWDLAESQLREALELKESALGLNDLIVGITCAALAVVLSHKERLSEARALHERALAIYRLDGNIPWVTDALNDLAKLAFREGDRERGRQLLEEAITLSAGVSSAWPEAVHSHMMMASLAEEDGDFAAAAREARKAAEVARSSAPESTELARALSLHGRMLGHLGLYGYGIKQLRRGLEMFERVESSRYLEAAIMKGNLGITLVRAGSAREGLVLLQESERLIASLLPNEHYTLAMARLMSAQGLARARRPLEAVQLLERAAADVADVAFAERLREELADLRMAVRPLAESPAEHRDASSD
jgi:tetratricopeptide (TPR) repeat protein